MKNILVTFSIAILFGSALSAQQLPAEYKPGINRLAKITDTTPAGNTAERICVDGNNIWLGTGMGLSCSTDNGNTWTNYYGTKTFGNESVYAVKSNNGIIWTGTWHMEQKLGQDLPIGTGVYYSTDNGGNWAKIDQPIDKLTDTVIIYGKNKIKIEPVANYVGNMARDFGFTNNTVWMATWGGGLRKSTDSGKTWSRVLLPPDNLNSIKPADTLNFVATTAASNNYYVFSICVVKDTIYVGTAGGINKSTDGGVSWVKFNNANQNQSISGNYIWSMSLNEYDNSIWAATWLANGLPEFYGLSRSGDGGKTWTNYLSGEKIRDIGFKYYGLAGNYSGADVIVTTENGVFRSSNNGVTWIAAPQMKDDNSNLIITAKKFHSVKTNRKNDGSTDIWMGSDNGLARLNETAAGFWAGSWKIYFASSSLASQNESYAFPNPFAPNRQAVNIKYSTSDAGSVTIRIMDFGMNLVRTIIQNAPRGANTQQLEIWDGKDENGRVVPNGVYFYRIDLGSGNPLFGKIMVLM